MSMIEKEHILELATDLVSAYVSNNQLDAEALPALIETVYQSMASLAEDDSAKNAEKPVPAQMILLFASKTDRNTNH